ncbi:MAG TPA: hypothetical protein PLD47_13795 [Aggregatilineales bacterium]|nr:hypothetical protein [Anaerolineales bacterium]HRE48794.1 hypothetical protein [Aggregatilineales bacterium]
MFDYSAASEDTAIKPRIYSLLVCSQVIRDDLTGGWQLNPVSHLAVGGIPIALDLIVVANVMAPPGMYELAFGVRHDEDYTSLPLTKPTSVEIMPEKNLEFMARVSVTLSKDGLYVFSADLINYDNAVAPIRITMRDGG